MAKRPRPCKAGKHRVQKTWSARHKTKAGQSYLRCVKIKNKAPRQPRQKKRKQKKSKKEGAKPHIRISAPGYRPQAPTTDCAAGTLSDKDIQSRCATRPGWKKTMLLVHPDKNKGCSLLANDKAALCNNVAGK